MEIKYIDLFAGIGGFRYGMESSNGSKNGRSQKDTQTDKGQGFQSKEGKDASTTQGQNNEQSNSESKQRTFTCVYSNEWDKYASQIYKKHYGECDDRDIRTVKSSEIPDFDLLVGGFPCQAFSIAGKRKGFDDTRGTLFFEIARILADKRPRYFILENVKGLLSHDEGKTFQTILGVLTDLGYEYQWQVLNSKNFGVPQNRERVFIIGHLRETSRPKVFPITEVNRLHSNEITKQVSDAQRIYNTEGIAKTLKGLGGGLGAKTGLYAMQWKRTEKGKEARKESQRLGKDNTPFGSEYRELVPNSNKVIGTITAQAIAKDSLLGNDSQVRRLTPTECERLQGFPDGWTAEGVINTGSILGGSNGYGIVDISDTQRYKCLGNAVTTNVITAIIERMI